MPGPTLITTTAVAPIQQHPEPQQPPKSTSVTGWFFFLFLYLNIYCSDMRVNARKILAILPCI